jgi:hypothetical protein
MVDQLTIQTIGVVVAATSVVLYIANLLLASQKEERNKKIAVSMNLLQTLCDENTARSIGELLNSSWTDFQDFLSKYDSSVNPDHFAKRSSVFGIYETLGYLLKHGLVDKELVYINGGMSSIFMWSKYKSVMEMYRKIAYGSDMMTYFEYFASEMWRVKREHDHSFVRDQTLGLDFEKTFGSK